MGEVNGAMPLLAREQGNNPLCSLDPEFIPKLLGQDFLSELPTAEPKEVQDSPEGTGA